MQTSRKHARVGPRIDCQLPCGRLGIASAALGDVVEIVRVAVPALEPVMASGLVVPKLNVGIS